MDCPFCPSCPGFNRRRATRISVWAPLALIATVLGIAAVASAVTEGRDPLAVPASLAAQGRAL